MRLMKESRIDWIGDIPAFWKSHTAFQLFTQVRSKNHDLKEQNLLSLSYGKIKRKRIDTTEGLLPESFDGYNIVEADDIVLRLTDLQNDHKSLRVGLTTERGIITSAYLTLRNRSESLAQYLYYFLHSFDIVKGFYGMGAGVRQGLNWEEMKWLPILTPPVLEQKHIVNFLDTHCALIDKVIEKTKTSIEEYKKLKQAIITQAITKGVRGDRRMKDSGIEWIGEIPEEWERRRLKSFASVISKGATPQDMNRFCEGDYTVAFVKGESIMNGTINYNMVNYITTVDDEKLSRSRLRQNDILFVIAGSIGKCGIVETLEMPTNINQAIAFIRLMPQYYFLSRYIRYYVESDYAVTYSKLNTVKSALPNLSMEDLGNMFVSLPKSKQEIEEIVDYLDVKCAELEHVIDAKRRLLSELDMFKKAVIYEYVTGKKEVPQS